MTTDKIREPLKNCPFCDRGLNYLTTLANQYAYQCGLCEASGPWKQTPDEAYAAWQSRAAQSQAPVVVEAQAGQEVAGFSRENLEAIAEGLEAEPATVNVGNVTGEGDELLESTFAAAARFVRAALAASPAQGAAAPAVIPKKIRYGSALEEFEQNKRRGMSHVQAFAAAVDGLLSSLAAAPSPQAQQPHPQGAEPDTRSELNLRLAAWMLRSYIECIKATGDYAAWHYIPEVEEIAVNLEARSAVPNPDRLGEQEQKAREGGDHA